jgi:hypothetical protein
LGLAAIPGEVVKGLPNHQVWAEPNVPSEQQRIQKTSGFAEDDQNSSPDT